MQDATLFGVSRGSCDLAKSKTVPSPTFPLKKPGENPRNPRECRWFHFGCLGGEKHGDKASPICADCLEEAEERARAPPAKRVRRGEM